MTYGVGIDLGTSFVSAALSDTGGTRMVPLAPEVVVPSVACVDDVGRLLTGTRAVGAAPPARTAQNFKRRLGDPTPLVLGDTAFSPAELMAAQLRDVLATITEFVGVAPSIVTLTCPAIWGPYRREQFAEVPRLAGVRDFRLTTEPEAAATHYSSERRLGVGEVVAVYDLGGGTFDTTILRMGTAGMELLGTPEGLEDLGGTDFDDALFAHVDERLDSALTALGSGGAETDAETLAALGSVRAHCVRAKERLSSEDSVTIPVPLPSAPHGVTVTRAEFDELIRPSVRLTIAALRQTVASAGIRPDELTAVLLAGGSSRVPLVTELVTEEFGRPVRATLHPKFTVALGAARLATPAAPGHGASATMPVAADTVPTAPVSPPSGLPAVRPAPVPATVRVPAPVGTTADASSARSRPWRRDWRVPVPVAVATAVVLVAALATTLALTLGQDDLRPAGVAPVSAGIPGAPAMADPTLDLPLLSPLVTSPWNGFVRGPGADDRQRPLGPAGAEVDALSVGTHDAGYTVDYRDDGRLFVAAKLGKHDLSAFVRSDSALVVRLSPQNRPGHVSLGMRCGETCGGGLDVTELVSRLPIGTYSKIRIPLSCFADAGVDLSSVTAPLVIRATDFRAKLSHARLHPKAPQDGPVTACSDLG